VFQLVQKRRWFFILSATLLALSLATLGYSWIAHGSPLILSIDFTGGSLLELAFDEPVVPETVRELLEQNGFPEATVQTVSEGRQIVVRAREMDMDEKESLSAVLEGALGPATELRFESVGPIVGRETTRAAVMAILAASVAILIFIAIAFRRVPNAVRYGICAITKMFHDVIILLGLSSLFGLVLHWEMDTLFLTAVVTVVGFSIQDVIVVFDRIRENSARHRHEPYETMVNRSLLETLHRSLATELNAMFVMVAIIFFGGVTIRHFMTIMLVGMVTGTYSSLFFAVPLLVVWQKGEWGRIFKAREGSARA
jgi:preprotein translocase SecF subunit